MAPARWSLRLSRRRSRPYALTLRGLEARATRDLGPILTNDRDPDLASIPRESHSQQGLPSCCGCSVGQFFRSAGHAHRTPLRQNILSRPANLDGKGSIAGTATRQACAYRGAWRSLLGGLVIPTLVLVGLALGVLIHDGASLRRSRRRCSGVGALCRAPARWDHPCASDMGPGSRSVSVGDGMIAGRRARGQGSRRWAR
jgi:hypothetical protein